MTSRYVKLTHEDDLTLELGLRMTRIWSIKISPTR